MLPILLSASLVLLGTAGGPIPKRLRAAPSQAIVVGDRVYVVDAGDGVGRRLRPAYSTTTGSRDRRAKPAWTIPR